MLRSTSTTLVALALAVGGVAVAAPLRDDNAKHNERAGDPQLDRAALYRTATVGECAAVRRPAAAPKKRERDAKPAQAEHRETLASARCNVVWSD